MTTPTAQEILYDPAWTKTELTRSEWLALRLADALAEVERLRRIVKLHESIRLTVGGILISKGDWIGQLERERDEARAKLAEREADTRRLDFMERQNALGRDIWDWDTVDREGNWRAAIDTSMRQLGLDQEGDPK